MAIVTNTATRYGVNGIREDFSDIIYNISPETTPFISNMPKRRKATNTLFEWQIDSLAAAASNALIDGDALSSFTAITATTKLSIRLAAALWAGRTTSRLDGRDKHQHHCSRVDNISMGSIIISK